MVTGFTIFKWCVLRKRSVLVRGAACESDESWQVQVGRRVRRCGKKPASL